MARIARSLLLVLALALVGGAVSSSAEWSPAGFGKPEAQIPLSVTQPIPPPLEIQPLIISGSSKNRVDLVFFSDGYLLEEKDKFMQDALRLAEDVSGNQTFHTVKPLLNFWAAFTASEESGVGTGGKPKNTPYGLYRDGTELRGVYYAHPEVADAACTSLGNQCDFPILLGNDPLYGGLGGQFTVITSSILNGPQILRHELGHSIIPVGEEYDGGFAYFGVNAYHDLDDPVPWAHWMQKDDKGLLLEEPDTPHSHPRIERTVAPLQTYPWTLLNTSSPYTSTFISSGTFPRYVLRFSLSGMPEKSDLRVELDGKDVGWEPRVGLGVDRWMYDVRLGEGWGSEGKGESALGSGLVGGEHELSFVLLNEAREGEAQLCSAEVLEFGSEDEFVSAPGYYGVFPTFSEANSTSYRPTNEDCLMRMVTTPNFCSVCLEGLWHALLGGGSVRLIEGIVVVIHDREGKDIRSSYENWELESESESDMNGDGDKSIPVNRDLNLNIQVGANKVTAVEVEIKLLALAQNRLDLSPGASAVSNTYSDQVRYLAETESYTITWTRDGVDLPEFSNRTTIVINSSEAIHSTPHSYSTYVADVRFHTPEVRVDKEGHLTDRIEMVIGW